MPDAPIKNLLPHLGTRREYFDYLDRWTVGTVDELRTRMTTRALAKAFLLETSQTNGARDAQEALAESARADLDQVDDTLFRMRWPGDDAAWALVEVESERYPMIYTVVDSEVASRRVDQLVSRSPLLDRAWLSASMFRQLWSLVVNAYSPDRFSRIVFEHESLYERLDGDSTELDETVGSEEGLSDEGVEEEQPVAPERRRARMQITERIGRMNSAVLPWEEQYDPLASIVQLRIPAPTRGGHDVYFNGRFTNRSDSTAAFRETVRDVMRQYGSSTTRLEDAAWPRASRDSRNAGGGLGAPLLIQFSEPLEYDVFERWIATLRRKNNRFRLWGNPLDMGPGKVHFYAVDNHLWQPIDLEIARDHVFALLPSGTCGNTVHRLITNIQRFVDPKITIFLGDKPYDSFVTEGAR